MTGTPNLTRTALQHRLRTPFLGTADTMLWPPSSTKPPRKQASYLRRRRLGSSSPAWTLSDFTQQANLERPFVWVRHGKEGHDPGGLGFCRCLLPPPSHTEPRHHDVHNTKPDTCGTRSTHTDVPRHGQPVSPKRFTPVVLTDTPMSGRTQPAILSPGSLSVSAHLPPPSDTNLGLAKRHLFVTAS